MKAALDVYMLDSLIGYLFQDESGQTLFQYSQEWLSNVRAIPISLSLPLQKEKFGEKQCKPFFAGVLPDPAKRALIARNLGISTNNDFAMLKEIGGECAGAIVFVNAGNKPLTAGGEYRRLTKSVLEKILRELPIRPLLAGDAGVRLSLAGAQDKIAVCMKGEQLFLPLGTAPSTHILKPDINVYKGIAFNEAYCMQLAKDMGLSVAPVTTGSAGAIEYLLIERYDRTIKGTGNPNHVERIHQEDFCQALGIVPDRKYQAEGGPSIADCFNLLRRVSTVPAHDLDRLLDAVIFNFLIGNHDAHGKNFSLLYLMDDSLSSLPEIRFAPLYDLICTRIYPNLTGKMAMKIGDAYEPDDVDARQFEKLAEQIGFARSLVKRRVIDLAENLMAHVQQASSTHPVADEVRKFVGTHCKAVLKRF